MEMNLTEWESGLREIEQPVVWTGRIYSVSVRGTEKM